MRISAKAEYACVAMIELAAMHKEPQPVRIKAIADAQGIPQRFLVQILLQLKTAGLVSSVRGASGGYQLARDPEVISLADIINAIDASTLAPDTALAKVVPPSPAVHTLLSIWKEIQLEEQRMLEKISLAELLRRQESHALTYQI